MRHLAMAVIVMTAAAAPNAPQPKPADPVTATVDYTGPVDKPMPAFVLTANRDARRVNRDRHTAARIPGASMVKLYGWVASAHEADDRSALPVERNAYRFTFQVRGEKPVQTVLSRGASLTVVSELDDELEHAARIDPNLLMELRNARKRLGE